MAMAAGSVPHVHRYSPVLRELAVAGFAALAYFGIRNLTVGAMDEAFANAARIADVEERIGLDWEEALQRPFLDEQAYDPASHIYTIMVATGTVLGQGTRMIQSFKLDPFDPWTKNTLDLLDTFKDYTEVRTPRFIIMIEKKGAVEAFDERPDPRAFADHLIGEHTKAVDRGLVEVSADQEHCESERRRSD